MRQHGEGEHEQRQIEERREPVLRPRAEAEGPINVLGQGQSGPGQAALDREGTPIVAESSQ